MYKEPKFIQEIHQIREKMSKECSYDVRRFAEMIRQRTCQKVKPKIVAKTG